MKQDIGKRLLYKFLFKLGSHNNQNKKVPIYIILTFTNISFFKLYQIVPNWYNFKIS